MHNAFSDTLLLIGIMEFCSVAPVKLVAFYILSSVTARHDHSVFIGIPGKGEQLGMIYYLLICLLKDGPIYLE